MSPNKLLKYKQKTINFKMFTKIMTHETEYLVYGPCYMFSLCKIKGGRIFRSNYKEDMDKTKKQWNQGREVVMARVGESEGGMQTTVLE